MASKRSACITISTESAITSRETSDARMPSCPIEMPSETAMVTNSKGTPPASRTATFARLARRSSGRLHGRDFVPARRHTDLGLDHVVVGEAHGAQHRARRRSALAEGDVSTSRSGVGCHAASLRNADARSDRRSLRVRVDADRFTGREKFDEGLTGTQG